MQNYTIRDFDREFPDDAACLDWLRSYLYPNGIICKNCDRVTKHHRVASRPSYSCDFCGHHVHPTSETTFRKSSTPLRLWFHAIFQMAQTRCGVSAKQIQRETGVTYKTAWRMFTLIRTLLKDDEADTPDDTVEADETYMGGEAKNMHQIKRAERIHGPVTSGKTPVFWMAQRETTEKPEKVVAKVVKGSSAATPLPHIQERVLPGSLVYTDGCRANNSLGNRGHTHDH